MSWNRPYARLRSGATVKPRRRAGPIGWKSIFFFDQLDAADAHDPAVLQGVLHREEAGEEARLVAERIEAAELHASGARLERPREVPAIDLRELRPSRRSGCPRPTGT